MQAYSHILSVCVTGRQWVLALFLERYDYFPILQSWRQRGGITALVCLWRGSWMGKGEQRASRRERKTRTWRMNCSTIPSERWWRTATCCTTLWAQPASSLSRAFHKPSYVTEHRVGRLFFFFIHSCWSIFIPTSWLTLLYSVSSHHRCGSDD